MTKTLFLLVVLFVVVTSFLPIQTAFSQGGIEVQCGQILENEFTDNRQEHVYLLERAPRESFEVSVEPFGDFLKSAIIIYGPSGLRIGDTDSDNKPGYVNLAQSPSISSGIISARGKYEIRIVNAPVDRDDKLYYDQSYFGGVGLYTLSIGCTSSDGTKIKPGDIALPKPTPAPILTATTQSAQTTQTPPTSELSSESVFSFLTIGQSYEITFGSQTKIVKLIELTDAGWAKIEVNGGIGWLNLYQVALIIPLD